MQRFHELRLSADGRCVYTRWGRVDKPLYRANKKSRYNTKEEALHHFHTERNEKLNGSECWIEKPGTHSQKSPVYKLKFGNVLGNLTF